MQHPLFIQTRLPIPDIGRFLTSRTDILTLDRVICCYPDMQKLVGLSAKRARKLYGLIYPIEKVISFPMFLRTIDCDHDGS